MRERAQARNAAPPLANTPGPRDSHARVLRADRGQRVIRTLSQLAADANLR